jgi:hypothetical protein
MPLGHTTMLKSYPAAEPGDDQDSPQEYRGEPESPDVRGHVVLMSSQGYPAYSNEHNACQQAEHLSSFRTPVRSRTGHQSFGGTEVLSVTGGFLIVNFSLSRIRVMSSSVT